MLGRQMGILERLRDEALDAEMISVKQRLNNPELSDEQRSELHKRKQMLPEMKKQPLASVAAIPSAQPAE